jgi:hypothetical protein
VRGKKREHDQSASDSEDELTPMDAAAVSEAEKKALQREQREKRLKERASRQDGTIDDAEPKAPVKPLGKAGSHGKSAKMLKAAGPHDAGESENEPKQRPVRAAKTLAEMPADEPFANAGRSRRSAVAK